MGFISHAQNYEDVTLFRALHDVENGFYIDVGAFHPETFSVTKSFYDRGWRGISIEPNPRLHALINEVRPRDINLGVAISNDPGPLQLAIYDDDALSTTSTETKAIHVSKHDIVTVVDVECRSLDSVWDEHVPADSDVHFLKLDMEGGESEVIRSFDWARHRPWIVVVESTKPETSIDTSAEWEQALLDAGYALAYNDMLNRFYVSVEHADLASLLNRPPSVHDHFSTAEAVALRRRVVELDERAARDAVELATVSAEAQSLRDALSKSELELKTLQERQDAMQASASWRITGPLRALARRFRSH